MKVCSICTKERLLKFFSFNKIYNKYQAACKRCRNDKNKIYYQKTIDHQKKRKKGYTSTPQFKLYAKKWRENNPEYPKKYREAHLAHARYTKARIEHRRRCLIKNAGDYSKKEWENLCAYFGNICIACYESKKLTIDHVIPLSLGGTNTIDNLQPLCKSCNSSKGKKTLDYRFWFMVA